MTKVMQMFAVIQTGGKQYVVKEGDRLSVEKLDAETGQIVLFDRVLLIEDGKNTLIGTPILESAVVKAQIVENYKDDKIIVFKKIRRKQYRRTRGHRQQLTKVAIVKIYLDTSGVSPEDLAAQALPVEPAAAETPAPKPKTAKKAAPAPEPKPEAKPAKKAAKAKAEKPSKPVKPAKPAKPAEKPKARAKKTGK
jgi:large subunit ribosomal protein L21